MEGTEDVDEATLLPPKLTRSSCIFECEDTDPELNSPQDRASWERLLKAAEIRRHDGILMIAATTKEDEIPQVLYHRQCRNQFVKKRDLDAIQKVASAEKPKRRELNRRKSSAELSSSSSRVYDPVCIFCLKSSKYLTNSKTREPLVQCVELRSDQTVRQAAVEKNDSRIIAIASRDLVAAEGHYHRSCYRRYTKKTSSKTNSETSDDSMAFYTDPDEEYAMTEEQCYNGLFRFIRDVIFEEPQVIKMTELCKHLLDLFVESGVGLNEVKASTKKHIHRKIKGEFGESIHVIPDERGKLLVYPDNLSTSQLVKENERLKEELLAKKQNTSNENMQMRNVSTILRNDVKQHDVQMPWPLKKQRLKTFSDIKVKRSFKTQGRCIIMKADRNLFAKMTLIGQTRKLDMKEVLSYRLGPIPWALANPDGTLRKTNKAQLSHRLAKDFSPVDTIPSNSACIIDGMAIVQKVMANSTNASFGEASKSIFSAVLREGRANHRIDVVFDIYKDNSIKYAERVRRGSESAMSFGKIASGHRLKQWKIFLQSGNNKTQLIDFLVDNWSNDQSLREKLERKELFLTHGEQCLKVTKDSISDVQDLHSSQEEADTRILLHAEHCGRSGLAAAVIISPDTDVFILAMAFTPKLKCPVYFKLGSKTRTEYMEVKKAVDALGHDKCACLLGLHSFTGCDTVSSFAGRGKVSPLGLLNHEKHMTTLQSLGQSWNLSNESLQLLETLTCSLYSPKTAVNSVNELRFNIFCAKKGEAESWQLPPCASSLLNHCKRANYQCAIWKRSLSRNPDIPSPVGHGWRVDDGQLVIDWGDASPAPEAVMELIACNCPRKCLKESCTCLQNGMSCTYLCKLPTCSNMQEEEEEEPGKIDFEGSSDDDDDE